MVRARGLRVPQILRSRPRVEKDDFLTFYYPAGTLRTAAGRLWNGIEEMLGIDLRGLNPGDDLCDLLMLNDPKLDSLDLVEASLVLDQMLDPTGQGAGLPASRSGLGSFGDLVRRIAESGDKPSPVADPAR